MKSSFKNFIILLLLTVVITSGFGCQINLFKPVKFELITLNWWGVWETNDDVGELINDFKTRHPNLTINYRKFRYEEYEAELIDALAEDRGPDLFSLPTNWLYKYQNKILPQPAAITLTYQEMKGKLKKEPVNVTKTKNTLTINQLQNQFVDVVYQDVIINNKIYGLPLFLDTLVLYYNRDLLNNFGIATPPQNWTDFTEATKKLTLINRDNEVVQAGAALGTAQNIPRAMDILSLLMMQNGSQMANQARQATFNQIPEASQDKTYNPGLGALIFYTDFANPLKEVYSWNNQLSNALAAFASGKLAMFFGYSYHLPQIKNLAPKLNFGLTNFPQIENAPHPFNYANYWVATVSKKTKYPDETWGFLNYLIEKEVNKKFLEKMKRPTALRSLIDEQVANEDIPELKIFASQVLTAKSWYHGQEPLLAEKYFEAMIDNVINGTMTPLEALNLAVQQINTTL